MILQRRRTLRERIWDKITGKKTITRHLDIEGRDLLIVEKKTFREIDMLIRLQEFFRGKDWGKDSKTVKRFQEDIKVLLEE